MLCNKTGIVIIIVVVNNYNSNNSNHTVDIQQKCFCCIIFCEIIVDEVNNSELTAVLVSAIKPLVGGCGITPANHSYHKHAAINHQ